MEVHLCYILKQGHGLSLSADVRPHERGPPPPLCCQWPLTGAIVLQHIPYTSARIFKDGRGAGQGVGRECGRAKQNMKSLLSDCPSTRGYEGASGCYQVTGGTGLFQLGVEVGGEGLCSWFRVTGQAEGEG